MGNAIVICPFHETDAGSHRRISARPQPVEPRWVRSRCRNGRTSLGCRKIGAGRDFRVAEQGGRLVGLAESSLARARRDAFSTRQDRRGARGAPAPNRHGIIQRRARHDGTDDEITVQTLVSRDAQAGMGFVSALGFAHIDPEISMKCVEPLEPPARLPPRAQRSNWPATSRTTPPQSRASTTPPMHLTPSRRYSPEEMMQVLNGGELWIASEDGQILGFALPSPSRIRCVDRICRRRTGAAGARPRSALVYRVLTAHGVSTEHPCWLNVSSRNAAALKIYRRLDPAAA